MQKNNKHRAAKRKASCTSQRTLAVLQNIAPGLDKDSLCEKGHIQKEILLNLQQREKKWAELLVSQKNTSQLSSDAKNYLTGLLGKERVKQLIPPTLTIRMRMTKIMMMLPGVRNKTKVMMMTAAFLYCPNQERHLRQILKIMVHIGIIPRSPCHTWIIFQTKFRIFAFFLVHFAWFSFLFFLL